jgi:hypothetical protein
MSEITEKELKSLTGGNVLAWIASAIAGGLVYDVWKEGVKHVSSGGYQGGSLHGQWGPR